MSFFTSLRNLFYIKIDNKVLHLQADISNFCSPNDLLERFQKSSNTKCSVSSVSINDLSFAEVWRDIVNDAYHENNSLDSMKQILIRHLYLNNTKVFIFYINNIPAATITTGLFRSNANIGSGCRFAVKEEFQNCGLGKFVLSYAYSSLAQTGIRFIESLIASKREKSFMIHSSIGFKPQTLPRYCVYKDDLNNINIIQKFRLKLRAEKYYKDFCMHMNKQIVKK